jgi:probable HAF family extracellular repeat protein
VVVVAGGSGQGRIVSSPAGIDCPGTCAATFAEGVSVALSASPHPLSKFVGYGGTCSGAGCTLTLRADAAISAEFAHRRYAATDLGAPAGAWWSSAIGMSPRGLLVAGAWGQTQRIFFWDGSMHDVGIDVGNPTGVNQAGTVVGASWDNTQYQWHAFRWSNGTTTLLDSLGGTFGSAGGVNDAGVVVGWSARGDGVVRATAWNPKGPAVDLGSLGDPWNGCSAATAINSSGVAVGESCTAGAGVRAARFRGPGEIDDLGSLGGYARAQGINDAGMIVGYSVIPSGIFHAFVYTDGRMVDAGTIPGTPESELLSVNGGGIAVGYAFGSSGPQRAIVYAAGQLLDLNTMVDGTSYTLTMATGIDEAGNIVAQGMDRNYQRAVLLRPQ